MGAPEAHRPVLLEETIQALAIDPSGVYVDGTFGRGGHSREILRRMSGDGRLISLDKDPAAVASGKKQFGLDARFSIDQGSFAMLARLVDEKGVTGLVNGILLDLGVSSPQLDTPERGFNYLRTNNEHEDVNTTFAWAHHKTPHCVHVVPVNDWVAHSINDCVCGVTEDHQDIVWIRHHALDGRSE